MKGVLTIDGSYGEGGGQLVRSTLALSILTGEPVQLVNIRAGRPRPELRPQHLTAVQAAATLSQATVTGAEINSQILTFQPQELKSGRFRFDIGTAGAVTLLWQTLLPPLCWATGNSRLTLQGGTHVPWSPSWHYCDRIFLPTVREMGLSATIALRKAGWYPQGGGEMTATLSPVGHSGLRPLTLTQRGTLRQVTVYALVSNLPDHIPHRECQQAASRLRLALALEPTLEICPLPAIGQGTLVTIVGEFERTRVGFSAMGKIGKRAERVADEAVDQFLGFYGSEATVDCHLADQLLLYLALAEGQSHIMTHALTSHVMVYAFGVGECAISISGHPGQPQTLWHTIRRVGTVTIALSQLSPGDVIGIRGPFGRGWPMQRAAGNDVVFVAGGIGLAPLRPAIYQVIAHREKYGRVVVLLGTRTPDDIPFRQDLHEWRSRFDMEVLITVDSAAAGWRGDVGVVTKLIRRASFDCFHTIAMICGPEIMMQFTVKELLQAGVDPTAIYLSMERNMKCALGFCGHCQLGPAFICQDGPVFQYDRLKFWFDQREF